MSVDLSVVLPKYNSKAMAVTNVHLLDAYLASRFSSYEIIVVDDGSRPEERAEGRDLPETARLFQLEENRGKGYAVRFGMMNATGRVRVFTDIDLPYHLSAIPFAYHLVTERGADYVAGDRTLFNSQYVARMPWTRMVASKVFSKFITLFVIGGIFDSQCGFKVFSAPLAQALFPLLTIDRFSFDVEIYYLLLKYNVDIHRIPVRLKTHERSTVNLFKHALAMAVRITGIPFKWYAGRYRSEAMKAFAAVQYWRLPQFGDEP